MHAGSARPHPSASPQRCPTCRRAGRRRDPGLQSSRPRAPGVPPVSLPLRKQSVAGWPCPRPCPRETAPASRPGLLGVGGQGWERVQPFLQPYPGLATRQGGHPERALPQDQVTSGPRRWKRGRQGELHVTTRARRRRTRHAPAWSSESGGRRGDSAGGLCSWRRPRPREGWVASPPIPGGPEGLTSLPTDLGARGARGGGLRKITDHPPAPGEPRGSDT